MNYHNDLMTLMYLVYNSKNAYNEAANETQFTNLKRFLNFQSIRRNRFIYQLMGFLHLCEEKAHILLTNKEGSTIRETDNMKKDKSVKYLFLTKNCLESDDAIIDFCDELIREKSFPTEVKDTLTKYIEFLILQRVKALETLKDIKHKNTKRQMVKVLHPPN